MKCKPAYPENLTAGVLLGTFIGDAIGAGFEGISSEEISPLDLSTLEGQTPRVYTDDTQMTISVFEEMLDAGHIEPGSLMNRFLKRFSPWRGYSGGMLEVIEKWRNGDDLLSAARSLYNGAGSFGNGAAVRSSPISCFFKFSDFESAKRDVKKCALLTHTHVLGIDGAVIQSYAVMMALNRVPLSDWIPLLFELPVDSAFKLKFNVVRQCIEHKASSNEIAQQIGNGSDALSAVSASLAAFLRNSGSFSDAVLNAIGIGGDTDTIGAMTGAIAGAWFGKDEIPETMMTELENGDEGKDYLLSLISNVNEE